MKLLLYFSNYTSPFVHLYSTFFKSSQWLWGGVLSRSESESLRESIDKDRTLTWTGN